MIALIRWAVNLFSLSYILSDSIKKWAIEWERELSLACILYIYLDKILSDKAYLSLSRDVTYGRRYVGTVQFMCQMQYEYCAITGMSVSMSALSVVSRVISVHAALCTKCSLVMSTRRSNDPTNWRTLLEQAENPTTDGERSPSVIVFSALPYLNYLEVGQGTNVAPVVRSTLYGDEAGRLPFLEDYRQRQVIGCGPHFSYFLKNKLRGRCCKVLEYKEKLTHWSLKRCKD